MADDTANKPPGEFIREELEARGWTQAELAKIMGRPIQAVNEILQAKKAVTPETATALGAAFGNGADEWMKRETDYRLSQTQVDTTDISRRAKMFQLGPLNEMRKRGWIAESNDLAITEKRLLKFFRIPSLDDEPQVSAATRKTDAHIAGLSPSQRAWCFRVLQLAELVPAAKFADDCVERCERSLRKLAAFPKETGKVGDVLAEHGIRFVVVEHLNGTKLDGATMWLGEDAPVIGMSLRHDRNDNFWFTLFHELSHVRHHDAASVDSDITGSDELHASVKPDFERRADTEASASIVDPKDLKSFILRVGPLYSRDKINQFANRMKVHPGLIVGQLHARNEFTSGYKACREMLIPVRDIVTSQALTDGWGKTIELKD